MKNKKRVRKPAVKRAKKLVNKDKPQRQKKDKAEDLLLQNFVGLQKVIVDLSLKINNLSEQVSKLLNLFEISAETLVRKDFSLDKKNEEEMLKKLDLITDQNKLMAKGITLMYDKSQEKIQQNQAPVPFQRGTGIAQKNPYVSQEEKMQPSITNREESNNEVPVPSGI